MNLYCLLIVFGVFLASVSQILLRKSALKQYNKLIDEYLNMSVLIAYILMFLSVFINLIALKNGLGVKEVPIIESLGYIFVPTLAIVFLKERLSLKQYIAIAFIITGVFVFYN